MGPDSQLLGAGGGLEMVTLVCDRDQPRLRVARLLRSLCAGNSRSIILGLEGRGTPMEMQKAREGMKRDRASPSGPADFHLGALKGVVEALPLGPVDAIGIGEMGATQVEAI